MAKRTKRFHGEQDPSLPFTAKAFRPYALALGEIALAWNDLHVSLSFVFCDLLNVGSVGFAPFQAVWQNIINDRMQRSVLVGVAKESEIALSSREQFEDIKWLCDQATSLEEFRNNALHSPLLGVGTPEGPYIAPLTGLGHPRATKLYGKDLLAEYRFCRDSITTLRNYATQIDQCLQMRRGHGQKDPKCQLVLQRQVYGPELDMGHADA
jgi:hypothetical protein